MTIERSESRIKKGRPVSFSAFNARIPETIYFGTVLVYTQFYVLFCFSLSLY